jgi:hypothetical protein
MLTLRLLDDVCWKSFQGSILQRSNTRVCIIATISIIQSHNHIDRQSKEVMELKDLLVSHIHYHGVIVNQARVTVLIALPIVVSF